LRLMESMQKYIGLRPRCTGPMEDENARASFGGSEAG
jgi:hypothetical protein